jgi:ribonuclease BN (tRNA processing enzyme)
MKITILGNGAAYPGVDQACSGYLVQEGNTRLLVDCGTGVLSKLQQFLTLLEVSDIVITHLHADHFIDLIPYRYALHYGIENLDNHKPCLYLPPDGIKGLHQVVSPFAENDSFFHDVFKVSEYDPESPLKIGNLFLQFALVKHYIPTYGISITCNKTLCL